MITLRTRPGLVIATAAALAFAPAGSAAVPLSSPRATAPAPGAPGAPSPPGAAAPAPPPAAKQSLYRLAGCEAHGPTRAVSRGPVRRAVAIGFDDGPARDTAAFVRMLERAHAQATFFTIGELLAPSRRDLLLRELRDGDVLADHSFTHPFLTRTADVRGQLSRTLGRIRNLTGYTPCIFRPPYGDYNRSVVGIARTLGLATIIWDVDPSDYRLPGTAAIEHRILSAVRPGSIILSHDGGGPRGQTLAAYPHIIASLRAKGYRIETIPQLLGYKPVYRRCTLPCDGLGVAMSALPADAIVKG